MKMPLPEISINQREKHCDIIFVRRRNCHEIVMQIDFLAANRTRRE